MSTDASVAFEGELPPWHGFELKRLPVLRDGMNPYGFQYWSTEKALRHNNFVLGLPTGTGKTFVSYLIWNYFKTKYPRTKLVVVTTANAVMQFHDEYFKFFLPDSVTRPIPIHQSHMPEFHGKNYVRNRVEAYTMWGRGEGFCSDLLVMNYSIFLRDRDRLIDAADRVVTDPNQRVMVVYDEATNFKNHECATHDAVTEFNTRCHKVMALTATLTKGKLEDTYGIFLGAGIKLSTSYTAFMREFCVLKKHPRNRRVKPAIIGYQNVGDFINRIKEKSIIIRKKDVSDELPTFVLQKSVLPHSEDQLRMICEIYNGVVDLTQYRKQKIEEVDLTQRPPRGLEGPEAFRPTTQESVQEDVKVIPYVTEQTYIRSCLIDPCLVTGERSEALSPKTQEIVRLLRDDFEEEKVVIYSTRVEYLQHLEHVLRTHKEIPDRWKDVACIHGEVNARAREDGKARFQDPRSGCNVLLISDAGAEALNLQIAQVLIVVNAPRSGGQLIQLAGRISRIGSPHTSLLALFLLMEDSQDEDEYLINNMQMQLIETVQGEVEQGLIDWDVLLKNEQSKSGLKVSKKELMRLGQEQLIFSRRQRRKGQYRKAVASI